ncbi:MAG: molybdopterin-dependent oxidoreductase [Thermodesulfobacteriota bacterium]|jgi:anaerobic selenocysteine-containing dehydrogenase
MSATHDDTGWHPTACILCYVNCGIEVTTQEREITRVRGDKAHPSTRGYLCQKAQRLNFYQNHADRLTTPLRRRVDGSFEVIDWDTAFTDIARRLHTVRSVYGGKAFAFYGGGGQGNHLGGAYGVSLLRAMGSSNLYNALAQEKTGDFWVNGLLFGAQNVHTSEDVEHCDLLVVIGCNPWLAHGFRNARTLIHAIKKDPRRHLLVIDPRRTEVAAAADLHLQLRPGTDAFLLGAMLALTLRRGGEDAEFLRAHTVGFNHVQDVLLNVPVDEWIRHAGVGRADVARAVDLILAARAMTVRVELGIQQGRHSTLNSYLEKLLFLLTGNFGRRGTNNLHTWLQPLWGNSRGERSAVTGQEQIAGLYPPNRFPAEVLTDHPDRLRAVWVDSANPLNTAANTKAMEEAFRALELVVVVDVALTETATHAHYVLPAASQYEKWEYTLFTFEFPTNYFHLRAPLFDPLPGTLPEPEIYTRLLRAMGDLPPEAELAQLRVLAAADRAEFMRRLTALLGSRRQLAAIAPVVLYDTLGRTFADGSGAAAPLWLAAHRFAAEYADAVRAAGLAGEGFALGEALFEKIRTSRSGTAFSAHAYEQVWGLVKHKDRKIHLAIPQLLEWLRSLDPATDAGDPAYPFTLIAGQRRMYNANQIFRHPGWRKDDPDGALHIHPDDLAAVGVADGDWIAVETRTGRVVVRAEADDSLRRGVVALPHGYGQAYPSGEGRVVVGPRLNLITASDDCDPIAATPHHKNVRVRLVPPDPASVAAAEAAAARVRALAAA